jgi:hypothetical protein
MFKTYDDHTVLFIHRSSCRICHRPFAGHGSGLGHPMEMVLATCLLSMRLGKLLGLNDDELRELYYLGTN